MLDKPIAGQDVRTLHRNVEQLVDGINSFMNMTAVYEGKVRGIGFLRVWPGGSEVVIKASDPGPPVGGTTKLRSTCDVSITPDPANTGDTVTVVGTVPGATGGTITFYIDGQAVGVYNINPANGTAGFNDSSMPPGTHLIRAHFSGDINLLPCDGSATAIINSLGQPNMTLTSDNNPSNVGEGVTWTVDLTGNPSPYPTGTVTLLIDGSSIVTYDLVAGQASFGPDQYLPIGHHNIEVDYNGDSHWGRTYRTLDQVVLDSVLIELAIIPNPVNTNTLIDFYVQVSGHSGTPTGQVVLTKDGSVWSAVATLDSNGQAHFNLPGGIGTAGDYMIAVQYSGDANYSSATSAPVDLSVTVGLNAITLTPTSYAWPLPGIVESIETQVPPTVPPFQQGLNNVYTLQTDPPGYTGPITLAIVNNPWGIRWNPQGQIWFYGPLSFGIQNCPSSGFVPPPGFWSYFVWCTGPSGVINVVNGQALVKIIVAANGIGPQYQSMGYTASGHCWLQATVGGQPLLVNGVSTYVLEFEEFPQ